MTYGSENNLPQRNFWLGDFADKLRETPYRNTTSTCWK